MEKERNQEFMRHAEEKGYLQTPSKQSILDNSRSKSDRRKASKLNHVALLNMSAMKLMDLGEVGACSRLKVCIMPGNYLTRFDVLANCHELVKLDLHSNQVRAKKHAKFSKIQYLSSTFKLYPKVGQILKEGATWHRGLAL